MQEEGVYRAGVHASFDGAEGAERDGEDEGGGEAEGAGYAGGM